MIVKRKLQAPPPTTPFGLSPAERAKKNAAVIAVLDAFMKEDEQDQRETWEFLKQALDEDRPSYRKLFPKSLLSKSTRCSVGPHFHKGKSRVFGGFRVVAFHSTEFLLGERSFLQVLTRRVYSQ